MPPQQAPPPPPMMTSAPEPISPPRKGNALSGLALALGAAGIALALIGMAMFPGPVGAAGPPGLKGDKGDTGDQGPIGNTGSTGLTGPNGSNGTACWDLNNNDLGDIATEDLNFDGSVNVLDCKGAIGPAGPGTIMVYRTSATATGIGSSCTQYASMDVTIVAPQAGTIIIHAWFVEMISHTNGIRDNHWFKIGVASNDCSVDQWLGVFTVDSGLPTDTVWRSLTADRIVPVSAGSYTYYLNGMMNTGQNAGDQFLYGAMSAVFYPS